MAIPLDFLRTLPPAEPHTSWGDHLATHVLPHVRSFLDCFPSSPSPAIFSPDGASARPPLSHNAIREFVEGFALPYSATRAQQLGPNDRVMVALPTTPEGALALLALSCYHTVAPVNTSCTAAELLDDARRLGVRAVVSVREAETRLDLRGLAKELDCEIVVMEPKEEGPTGLFTLHLLDDEEQQQEGRRFAPTQLCSLDDQTLVLQTSGTSGKKKVVPYPLRNLIVGTCAVILSWDLTEADININMMPLFHVGGIVRNLFAPILSGGSVMMCPGFDATQFWALSVERGITWYYAAPTMHQAILGAIPDGVVPSRDTRIRLICNAAGGLLPTLAEQLKNAFGAVILPSYGSTECMPIASPPTTYKLERPGCSGIACGPYLSIRDPGDIEREFEPRRSGAVCVRGIPTFAGYETDRAAPLDTSTFSKEGWFDTGDCGYVDEDGYLYITGRSKEIINRGGEVISPFEIEEAILVVAKDRVKATIAFSVEHDVLQEAIGVVVVPEPGKPRISLAQLQDLLKRELHPSKWPFVIVYMDALPKNAAGKPLRIKLANRLGLGVLTDSHSQLSRHFTAEVPGPNVPLSEPIACERVSVDLAATSEAIRAVTGVHDAAVRHQSDGGVEAFVAVSSTAVHASMVLEALAEKLHGYMIPSFLHALADKLHKIGDEINFASMEAHIRARNSEGMTGTRRVVGQIIANLLGKDVSVLTPDTDFFLLGGNSLLLGRLSYNIRKETGIALSVSDLFSKTTIGDIALLVDASRQAASEDGKSVMSRSTMVEELGKKEGVEDVDEREVASTIVKSKSWGQSHPVSLIVQAIPTVFFYPLKAAWTWMLVLTLLSCLQHWKSYWLRACGLVLSIIAARLSSRIICPIVAIIFKWIVIGTYKPGEYELWSTYHLRWWIVNAALRAAGRGIFSAHPVLIKTYCRLLGARIGKGVRIDSSTTLAEFDLLTLGDNCVLDKASIRGFCVERDGYIRLASVSIGHSAVVNTYTQISPGAKIPDGAVYGPHASSHDSPASPAAAVSNRCSIRQPHSLLICLVAWPLIALVMFISYIPWLVAIYCMIEHTDIQPAGLNDVESVIVWFSTPRRIAFHLLARVFRDVFHPVVQAVLGIAIKRVMGLNKPAAASRMRQWSLLRRYIANSLLSQRTLQRVGDVFGTHYELTSILWRAMGAKVGKRVYWPGSGVYCPDPELLEIGDDVVFGSRSEAFTSDGLGSDKIVVADGAMIADRVVLLPGCTVGRQAVMGSGALARRGGVYPAGSVWIGNEGGEAVMLSKRPQSATDDTNPAPTITPFGRAYYKREASFFVLPYPLIFALNFTVASLSAVYWASTPVSTAQILRVFIYRAERLNVYAPHWTRTGVLYGLIAMCFIVFLTLQSLVAIAWVILTKWLVIGRRREGSFSWDKSSYCQRWQTHLTLSRPLNRGRGIGGVLAPLAGSAYMVWYYRAQGAKIGSNCAVWAGGKVGLMTEPDMLELGDNVTLDDCSVVAHINSRGNFQLNRLRIGSGCAMRTGSRLLSGACMESGSMLLEHTLLPSGEIADAGQTYRGWPARRVSSSSFRSPRRKSVKHCDSETSSKVESDDMSEKAAEMC